MHELDFFHKCPLSPEDDKSCAFALVRDGQVKCAAIMGWWHDLSIADLKSCFSKLETRDKIAWRNRQLKKKFSKG